MDIDHGSLEIEEQIPPLFYLYKDGSVRRPSADSPIPSSLQPLDGVVSKDVSLNSDLGLWARIFLPYPTRDKLPLVLFIHGGGFIFGSPASSNSHGFCSDMARRSNSIWVSTSYRLAPEHRLPAAYDDCFAAFCWVQSQAQRQADDELLDPWLAKADFSRCFLAGESAGGNIAHHVVIRASREACSDSLSIRGLILLHPAFGRENKTQAERDGPQDEIMNWKVAEICLRLALPAGANGDHPFFNPFSREAPDLRDVRFPRMLVALADGDILKFACLEFCEAMRKAGHSVEVVMSKGGGHVFYTREPESDEAKTLKQKLANFITQPHEKQGDVTM